MIPSSARCAVQSSSWALGSIPGPMKGPIGEPIGKAIGGPIGKGNMLRWAMLCAVVVC